MAQVCLSAKLLKRRRADGAFLRFEGRLCSLSLRIAPAPDLARRRVGPFSDVADDSRWAGLLRIGVISAVPILVQSAREGERKRGYGCALVVCSSSRLSSTSVGCDEKGESETRTNKRPLAKFPSEERGGH